MKRDPHLHGMTSEHHHALVLADRLRTACAGGSVSRELVTSTCHAFDAELNPHFVLEEELMLPALIAAGRTDLVDRTTHEHRELRTLIVVVETAHDPTPELRAFADLLTAHVRFEEGELFDAAQGVLTAAELEHIAQARPHSRPGRHDQPTAPESGAAQEGKP